MSNLTSALEIGRSALRAQQIGLNVAGNNIANVNTPSYSRKGVKLTTTVPVLGVGTGVQVTSLTRVRDRFIDTQLRFEGGNVGQLEALEEAMLTIEAIFTELAGGGATEAGAVFTQSGGSALSGSFSRFFNAFQDLANNPESQTARAVVREEATYLTDQFHRLWDQLSMLRSDLDKEFQYTVEEVNRLTRQIANMNTKILSAKESPTDVAGDLEDERDRLIDELSRMITMSARYKEDGTITIQALEGQGIMLVEGGHSNDLGFRPVVRSGASVSDLTQADTGALVSPGSGKLEGIMIARDEKVVAFQESIDFLAGTLVTEVNAVHAGGFGLDGSSGTEFFNSARTTAREMVVADAIQNDLDKIAASTSATGTGDGSNALALSDLRAERILGGATQTVEEYYAGLIGQVGAEAKEIYTDAEGQRLVIDQIETRRKNLQGVSINEEAISLILFQRAYQAAARIVTTVDEMMQTAVNM